MKQSESHLQKKYSIYQCEYCEKIQKIMMKLLCPGVGVRV
jgi:hypothetical protein